MLLTMFSYKGYRKLIRLCGNYILSFSILTMSSSSTCISFDPIEPVRGLIKFLTFVGIWPLNSRCRFLYIIYGILFQFTFSYAYTAFGITIDVTNMKTMTEQIFVGLAEVSMCLRVTNFLFYFKEASAFLKTIKSFEVRSQEEAEIYRKKLFLFSTVMTFFVTCTSFAVMFSNVAPLFNEEYRLPYPGWYPLDWKHDITSYWIVYIYQLVGGIFLAHTLVRLENYQIYCMICASAQIEIIALRLSKLGYTSTKTKKLSDQRKSTDDLVYLLECVKIHKSLMKFISDMERVFSIPFIFQLFCSSVIFCVTGYRIIIMEDDTITLAYYVCFLSVFLNEIFLPCYFGTLLTLTNNGLAMAIYSSNWTELSQPFKKTMILFLEYLKRPRIMRSGKIFTLSLFSFLTVINRSYSLFAVLRNLIK